MRIIPAAALTVTLCLPVAAQAQSQTITGSSAAGLCAAAMEFVAGARSASGIATPQELSRLQKVRETLLALPQFPKGEVQAYAEAWSKRMAENVSAATSPAQINSIAKDIAGRALKCQQGMVQAVNNATQNGTAPLVTQPAQ